MAEEIKRGDPSFVSADLGAAAFRLTEEEVRERMSGNLCRCGAYNGILDAIKEVFGEAQTAADTQEAA
jgi:xanthine dehydrogenase YagT iron-sulfur-binding subunit